MNSLNLTRRSVLGSSLALIAAPALIGRAKAATTTLRFSSALPNNPKYSSHRAYFDSLLRQLKVNGIDEKIELTFFPDNQLGQEVDVINALKLGVVGMMVGGSSIWATVSPLAGTFDLGYLFDSFAQQTKAFEAGASKPVEEALLKAGNVRVVSWAYNFGARSILAKKAVNTPEDLVGLKIRSLPNPIITECIRLMGAAATPLAFGEVYTGLQAGVIDGLEHDAPTILASKFYETAKHYSKTEETFQPLIAVLSDVSLQRMDPKLREPFLDAAKNASIDARAAALKVEAEAIDILKSNGVEVRMVDKEPFRKRVQPQTEAFVKARPETKSIVELIRATKA